MSITSLPAELVYEICRYLQLSEWQALRLACRKLYSISLKGFVEQNFKSVTFVATIDGLQELEEMAESDFIRGEVQELWMIPTLFEGREIYDIENTDYRVPSGRRYYMTREEMDDFRLETCSDIMKENLRLIKSESFSDRLHRCLLSFNNIDTLGIAHYSTAFLLDPRQNQVRFLGCRPLKDKVECEFSSACLTHLREYPIAQINSLALSKLFQALDGCNLKIKKLHTCNRHFCGNIAPEIYLEQEQYDSLLSALDELEDLHVCINYEKPGGFEHPKKHIALRSPTWLNLIVKVAPQLKKLALSQDFDIHYMYRPFYFKTLCQNAKFIQLRELHLYRCRLTSRLLKLLVTKTKATLTSLTLCVVTLVDGGDAETDADIDLSTANEDIPARHKSPYDSESPGTQSPLNNGMYLGDSDDIDDSVLFPPEESRGHLWKTVWDFFRDELSLQWFVMEGLSVDSDTILIQGPRKSSLELSRVAFDAKTAGISFGEWIDQFTPVEDDRVIYSSDDSEYDNWYYEMMPVWCGGSIPCKGLRTLDLRQT